ncbi:MlaA family lipoprotein [Paracraurococcus lichenis]|uniref:VacJ family lipoprotein n=1 Tax=Paracraurococcus lichenis TaxID=3064888 RepID=A0ABT9E6W3_9PROT|nr:VacJ family lipoprotein [Paracraurococcus sp. LOR1-02]MDO9711837.1 VacJ family lipoprotein [Paracraurococcus sp. LOR1-02]
MQRLPPTLLCLALALSACAPQAAKPRQVAQAGPPSADTPPTLVVAAPTDPGDPFEATNRRVLDFNFALDDAVLKPVALGYREVLGPWPRARIRNFLQNLNEPAVLANRLLQGRPIEAGTSLMRFVVNTTLGLGGLFDLESIGGPPKQVADFGQTLAMWGVGDGPYLMVPVVGPSNPRELTGSVVNGFLNPVNYPAPFVTSLGRSVALGVDERERNIETIDDLRTNSLDVYARLRSLWRQHRDAELGRAPVTDPDVLEDPGEDAPAVAPAPRPAPQAARPARAERRPVAHPVRKVVAKRKPPSRQVVVQRGDGRRG